MKAISLEELSKIQKKKSIKAKSGYVRGCKKTGGTVEEKQIKIIKYAV